MTLAPTPLGYPLFDADNHYYEPTDAFSRHVDPALPERKRLRWIKTENGRSRLLVGDRLLRFVASPTFDPVAAPGALEPYFRGDDTAKRSFGELRPLRDFPEYQQRGARLDVMDRQGIEAALFFPSLGVGVEHLMEHDAEMTYANLRAFNLWLEDDWGFDFDGRIFAAPMMSLVDPDLAASELSWAIDRGARVVYLRAGPANGRSPGDGAFDRFWAQAEDSQVIVAFHAADDSYNEIYAARWGQEPNPSVTAYFSAFQAFLVGDKAICDTMAALVLQGVFTRFPRLKVASIELGSQWVQQLKAGFDRIARLGRSDDLDDTPWNVFREHVYVSPFYEEDIPGLIELLGPGHVLFGSDWPHDDCVADPISYLDSLPGVPEDVVRLVMHENTRALLAGKA
jgi:predicted TIM-barrel fold metal-dependent hydrolase